MTIRAARLLRKLKRAQIYQDSQVFIDDDNMTVGALHDESRPYRDVSLKGYENSLYSTLDYLQNLGYVEYDDIGIAKVTHAGWSATTTTLKSAIQFTAKDIVVPIIVAVISAAITTIALS